MTTLSRITLVSALLALLPAVAPAAARVDRVAHSSMRHLRLGTWQAGRFCRQE